MPDHTAESASSSPRPTRARWFRRAGYVFVGLGLVLAGWQATAQISSAERIDLLRWLVLGGMFFLFVGIGALSFAISLIVRQLERTREVVDRLDAGHQEIRASILALKGAMEMTKRVESQPMASSPPEWREELDAVVRGLAEVRELALMSDAQRQARRERMDEEEVDTARAQIRYLIGEGNFREALTVAEAIARQRPQDPRATELTNFVESARRQRESAEVAAVRKEINDLLSMSAWPQARQKVQWLLEQHPDSAAARQLMVHIEREYHQAMEEQRRRMYAEVQRFVTRKRWEEALVAARTFVERFEGSDDAEAVRMQIPTLEVNAEIEVRQQLEAQIMDLARHGRYIEAATLARRVIEQYPESPQAEALRSQIGRLEELATNPHAPPARIRLDEGPSRLL